MESSNGMRACILALGGGVASFLLCAGCACSAEPAEPNQPSGADDARFEYSARRYIHVLDEVVTYEKTPHTALVVRADGRIQSTPSFEREIRSTHRALHGVLRGGFSEWLARQPDDQAIPIAVYYESDHDRAAGPSAATIGASTPRAPSEAFQWAAKLAALGVESARPGRRMPVVFGRARPKLIRVLARTDGIALIASAEARVGYPQSDDPIPFHHIDTVFNDSPTDVFAENQKIGIVEPEQGTCRIFDEHDAFSTLSAQAAVGTTYSSNNTIHYQVAPPTCGSDLECDVHCHSAGHPARCVNGQCVVGHGSEVASVVSASNSSAEPRSAGKATLYFPNDPGDSDVTTPGIGCSPDGTERAYAWLLEEGVQTVNESFVCRTFGEPFFCEPPDSYELARDNEGITQDWYARYQNMLIVKIAGNHHCGEDDEACPYTLNSVCVGGNNYAESAGERDDVLQFQLEEPGHAVGARRA